MRITFSVSFYMPFYKKQSWHTYPWAMGAPVGPICVKTTVAVPKFLPRTARAVKVPAFAVQNSNFQITAK